jgi:excisionase family DNA binding protein
MKTESVRVGGPLRPLRAAVRTSDCDDAQRAGFPTLLTVDETAKVLRTTRRAIYAMVERRQLPAVIRIRRRVLIRADDLLHWLNQKRAPSPEE